MPEFEREQRVLTAFANGLDQSAEPATPVRSDDACRSDANGGLGRNEAAADLVRRARRLADEIAARPNLGRTAAPVEDLKRMAAEGLLTGPLPMNQGGLGLGTEPGGQLALLRILAATGGGDLALGRLYEGHVNALILISAYGTPQQLDRAARDAKKGLLFGVWNTGGRKPLEIVASDGEFRLDGGKLFASGAAFVARPIVTGERNGLGWQMTLPAMEAPRLARVVRLDRESWHPLGMEASESYGIEFAGAMIAKDDLIGAVGDFYREPLFRGGAIRFAAVHAGAVLRLHRMFAEWLQEAGRGDDPYQIARLGEVALSAQEAILWIERAAEVADREMRVDADKLAIERMLECANMTRLAIERLASATMTRVVAGVGARGLLQPSRFERIVRDLTMYLRQPAPDHTLAEVGRSSLRKSRLRTEGAADGLWRDAEPKGSLPPVYFQKIYAASQDPWNFERSRYEAEKYHETLASLPRERYSNALEVGCSIGVLTEQLGKRCESLLGVDVSAQALKRARERCAGLPQVTFECMQVPVEVPDGAYDLMVISEVAYYWQRDDLERAMTLLAARQPAGGHLVLVHFTDPVPDYPLTGDEVHGLWLARSEWKSIHQSRHDSYRLDVLERTGEEVLSAGQ